jgi:hypothetical protein
MDEILTEELLFELLTTSDPAGFIDSHCQDMGSLPDLLDKMLKERGLKRIDVIHDAMLNETFGYQIFAGTRHPSRNKLLQIAFAMKLNLRETNHLLQAGGASGLYCKTRRDAIIIFCMGKDYTLAKTNDELYRFDEETIC